MCVNNDGGGIFDFLPVAEHAEPEAYERHIATDRTRLDMAALAALGGARAPGGERRGAGHPRCPGPPLWKGAHGAARQRGAPNGATADGALAEAPSGPPEKREKQRLQLDLGLGRARRPGTESRTIPHARVAGAPSARAAGRSAARRRTRRPRPGRSTPLGPRTSRDRGPRAPGSAARPARTARPPPRGWGEAGRPAPPPTPARAAGPRIGVARCCTFCTFTSDRLVGRGHPQAHRRQRALDAPGHDGLLLAVLGGSQQLLAEVVVHRRVGAAARGAGQRHGLARAPSRRTSSSGARADEGELRRAHAVAVSRPGRPRAGRPKTAAGSRSRPACTRTSRARTTF